MEIIQKTCPGYPGSIVVPLYTTRKTEQMETAIAYFFAPSLTGTIFRYFQVGKTEKVFSAVPYKRDPPDVKGAAL